MRDTGTNGELSEVVNQIEDLAYSVAGSQAVDATELRRVLGFVTKVVQVVDHAFQDVLALLIELTYVTAADLREGRLQELSKAMDLLVARSRYRDAEEICSRLHHLREQFEEWIAPTIQHLDCADRWQSALWLLEEREGRIIMLVQRSISELREMCKGATARTIYRVRKRAAAKATGIRCALIELRSVTNEIMGLSGRPGFLELTRERDRLASRASIFMNKGAVIVSRDTYSGGQVGAMGPHAHAHDISFEQVWIQSSKTIDLKKLREELERLRAAMKARAKSADEDAAVGAVAAAEGAARKGDGPGALQHLKNAGRWALDAATEIGTTVAAAAINKALGVS